MRAWGGTGMVPRGEVGIVVAQIGLFATALSAVAISIFFAPPYHRLLISDDEDIFGVALFTMSGEFVS